ncbi:MAG: EF-P lysine aminoacylase EpmA [Pseudomonadota bacterium]
MTSWRPSSGPQAAQHRAAIKGRLRQYFEASGALAVDTPALSPHAVSDTQIESLAVSSALSRAPLYLHTSPEFHMKRLLAAGYPDIYSMCRVFRDGEAGRSHQPEFTMIEWYRLGAGLTDIIEDTIGAISAAIGAAFPAGDVKKLDYGAAFQTFCGIDPFDASIDELADVASADDELRKVLGDQRDDWLDLLVSTRIVPNFADDSATVLQHYPASQAALAQRCPDDAGVADRFEVFLGSVEVANGYVELTDASELAARIAHDQAERKRRNRTIRPHDTDLLAALEHGLPACAGVAMGLERLQMIHDATDDIRDVITFAFGGADD